MHGRKRFGTVLLALSLIGVAGVANAATTGPADPVLVSASVARPTVAVSGLNSVVETVSVHLTDPDGVCVGCGSESQDPVFALPAAIFSSGQIVPLKLARGTVTDGIWKGTFAITTQQAGHQTLTHVIADGGQGDQVVRETDIVPADHGINVTINVTATHASSVSVGVVPNPATYHHALTWKGRAYFPDTGAPIANHRLVIGSDTNCGIDSLGNATVTTDSRGYWSYTEANAVDQVRCVVLTGTGDPNDVNTPIFAFRSFGVVFAQKVSIVLATTPVKLGTKVAVTGGVGTPFGTVLLQRMVSGQWVAAGTAQVRESGRYTLYASPPAKGNWRYRVVAVASPDRAEGISKTVILGVN